jgi:hypothetical protein
VAYLKAASFQDRGKTIPIDAPVSRYLPELANMQVSTEKTDPTTGKTKLGRWRLKSAR